MLRRFVQHMKTQPGVRFVTAQDLPGIYEDPVAKPVDRKAVAAHLEQPHRLRRQSRGGRSPPPTCCWRCSTSRRRSSTDRRPRARPHTPSPPSPPPLSARAVADAADFIRRFHRLPNEVFIGAETLSLADFAATLAGSVDAADDVKVLRGNIEFDRYFATDGRKPFNWVIHPEGFDGTPLLDLGRLQGWTLKPATFR